jgi:hypothetical protein
VLKCHALALDVDDDFLTTCHFPRFQPISVPNVELLFTLGNPSGPGITPVQFQQIMKQCGSCQNLCFTDVVQIHRCRGQVLRTHADGFNLVEALLSHTENAGLSRFDLFQAFTRCDVCENVLKEGSIGLHSCTGAGDCV